MVTDGRPLGFLAQLSALDANAAALFTIPANRLAQQPGPGKWSALQAVEHIVLVNRAYFPGLRCAIDDARSDGQSARAPFRLTVFGRLLVWSFEPPPRLRLPVPSRTVVPASTVDVGAVRRRYEDHHAELRQLVRDAQEVDMHHVKIRSPFVKMLSVRLGTAIAALLAHERRHLYQARKAAI